MLCSKLIEMVQWCLGKHLLHVKLAVLRCIPKKLYTPPPPPQKIAGLKAKIFISQQCTFYLPWIDVSIYLYTSFLECPTTFLFSGNIKIFYVQYVSTLYIVLFNTCSMLIEYWYKTCIHKTLGNSHSEMHLNRHLVMCRLPINECFLAEGVFLIFT